MRQRAGNAYSIAGLEDAFPQYIGFAAIAETHFSAVFSVEERTGGRRLALKLTRANHDDDLLLRKFDEEYRLLSSMMNDRLVTVVSYGRTRIRMTSGTEVPHNWYAMHLYQEGSVLSKLRTLDLRARVEVVDQMLLGLSFLHIRNIAHRDIKPHNLFLASVSPLDIKIGDFGIAKGQEAGSADGNSRMVGGTPQYMAPERMLSSYIERPNPDWRPSDQYAAGVTIYQILSAGRFPLDPGSEGWGNLDWGQILQIHLQRPLQRLRIPEAPALPCDRTYQVIAKMMAIEIQDRYPSINECRRSLASALLSDGLLS